VTNADVGAGLRARPSSDDEDGGQAQRPAPTGLARSH
jgi:hypothetical protein